MMGVVLVIIGYAILALAFLRSVEEGPRFRHVFWGMVGFWIATIGVFV